MGDSEHLQQILIQVMLGLAVFSFLEYSIRTANAPAVVNRRAKLLCAAGLTLAVLGMIVLDYHLLCGVAMIISGSATSVFAMVWLQLRTRALAGQNPGDVETDVPQGAPDDANSGNSEGAPAAAVNSTASPDASETDGVG